MRAKQDVSGFIRATFRSVWSLELLCFLRNRRESAWTHAEMIAALRASDLVITQSLESLLAAGLIMVEDNGAARYHPISETVDALVAATEDLYLKQPNAVRRLIVAPGADGLESFANAFKLWKD